MNVEKKWTFLAHLPTSSCKRSLWMTPTEMAGSEWGKPYSWSIKLCKSAPAKSAVGDHIYSPLLLLLLAIIQKRTQYLCYGLLKKKWKWRIVWGQDRTTGPKLSLFSKMFDWITGSLNWAWLFFRLLLKSLKEQLFVRMYWNCPGWPIR